MKKILSLMLALVICVGSLFALVGCGEPELNFGKKYRDLTAQMDVLVQLDAKSVDVGVMDSIMAGYYMSTGAYKDSLMVIEDLTLATEQYGIAARKGSGLAKMISKALIENYADVVVLAEKYGIASELCINTNVDLSTFDLTDSEKKDWNFIKEQGTFIVGYTIFAPIAYKDANGELIGFDIELAKLVANKLGVKVRFTEIEWDSKEALLEGKSIDCVWNGMTITPEREEAMEITIPYLNNKQVAVIRKEDATKYTTTESMAEAIIAAEAGSAGESCVIKE